MSRQTQPIDVPHSGHEHDEALIAGEGDENMEDEEIEEQEEGYTSSTPTSTLTWISWFCSLPGHEYFCEVTEDFIEDDFNLTGLNTMVPFWKEAMEMVLDVEAGAFFGTTFAHLFFQSYRELAPAPFWKAPSSGGSSVSPRSASGSSSSRGSPFVNPNPHGGQKRAAGYVYVPRIYGFKVSERAKSGPRMQWLRLRPESPSELDLVDWRGRWIDEDDDYDDVDDDGERQMEEFDPDNDDVDDDEEEEEEDDDPAGHIPEEMQRRAALAPPLIQTSARTSPTSSAAPRTPQEPRSTTSPQLYTTSPSPNSGKVRVVRQWGAGTSQV
ncbi:hypothetical protein HGRIS_009546 [Hohenbuehelia grisea]|uniref:Casein kinase II subunit beta n=1 Tax=Hohenbuehelia grisea TaxID=104357 RepID=A0ABR3J1H6_9AGAR